MRELRELRVLRSDRLRNKCAMTGKRHPELNSGLKENIFTDTDFSRFTSHFSLKRTAFTLAEGATHVAHWNNSRKIAFTLAEVLITLGIIGVVAAMTMPTLINQTNEKETVVKLKKVYSILQNAYKMAELENSEITNWYSSSGTQKDNMAMFYNNLKPYLKIAKDCGDKSGCLTEGPIKTLDGRDYNDYNNNSNEYKFILTDGTTMWFFWNGGNACTPDTDECGNIKVDINGKKGKYAFGRDVFIFDITPKGIVPAGMQGTTGASFEDRCNMSKKTDANGYGCTAWVLHNENLDYLHCNDLSWDGKHSCRDKVNK